MSKIEEIMDNIVNLLTENVKKKLGNKIESIFVAGSYTFRKHSLQAPNVNYYIISKAGEANKLLIPLSEIIYEIRDEFKEQITIIPDLKPYRVACYMPEKGKVTLTLRVNVFDIKDADKKFHVPDYVLRGWQQTQKILYGKDVLSKLPIKVALDLELLNKKMFILLTVMQQLKHMPFTYDWRKQPSLLFHEAYEYAKYLLGEGLLLKTTKEEIEKGLDIQIYLEKEKFVKFYEERYGVEAGKLAQKVLNAREHYLEWMESTKKAIEMYLTAWQIFGLVFSTLMKLKP